MKDSRTNYIKQQQRSTTRHINCVDDRVCIIYKYNHGVNRAYFKTTYKVWWFVGWNVVGITFATDTKMKISKQAAMEDELKRNRYIEQELSRNLK